VTRYWRRGRPPSRAPTALAQHHAAPLMRVDMRTSGPTSEHGSAVGPATQPEAAAARLRSQPGPRVGYLLSGRYELGHVIGRGGMSTVHRAYDRWTGHEVAVKIARPAPDGIDAIGPARREVGLLSTLDDPGLVALLDADIGDGRTPAYLVSELVDGPNLAQWIRSSTLTEQQTARLGAAMSRTLAYVHGRGVVHRDVKPANILISRTDAELGAPKLVDFGIAATVDGTNLAADDATVGTANYLSPEQVRGDPITPATDIYSLGLVLIEALTGTLVYPGTGAHAAMARLDRSAPIPEDVSRGLRAVLADMTACDPADRPAAGRAAKMLDGIAAGYGGSLSDEILMLGRPTGEPDRLPFLGTFRSKRRRIVFAAAAAVVLGRCAAFAAAISSSDAQLSAPPPQAAAPAAPAIPVPPPESVPKPAPPKLAPPLRHSPAPAPAQLAAARTSRHQTTEASHVVALPKRHHAHRAKHGKATHDKAGHGKVGHRPAAGHGKDKNGRAGHG
jgi:eukaryotic-like serine/threonine-protein kinase